PASEGETVLEKHEAHVRCTANEYDEFAGRYLKPFDDFLAKRVTEAAMRRLPQATLLDVGTGTARFLIHIARLPSIEHVRLAGTDFFEDMVKRAQSAISEAGLGSRIDVWQDDVHEMRIAEGFADILVSRSTLHHWHTPVKALGEIFRVLKPGGIAMIHDLRRDPAPEAITEFNRLRGRAGIGASFLDEKFTVEEVRDMLEQAGLSDYAQLYRPSRGLMGLGFAVELKKPGRIVAD